MSNSDPRLVPRVPPTGRAARGETDVRRGTRGAAVVAGAGLAWHRLWGPAGWLTAILAVAACVTLGAIERHALAFGAPDRVMGALVALLLPLTCFAFVHVAVGPQRCADSAWRVARWGLPRGWVVCGMLLSVAVVACGVAVLCVAASLLPTHARTAALGADLLTSSWIAALGATGYVAFYAAGATFLAAGRGRWLALGLDFVLGGGHGVMALFWLRSHLANLAGGVPVLGWEQSWSSGALVALAVLWAVVTCVRCRG